MKHSKKLPDELKSLFEEATKRMSKLFGKTSVKKSHSTINIDKERYIFIRAASLSSDFFDCVANSYGSLKKKQALNFTRQILFDFAHAIGKKDAAFYRKKLKLKTIDETFVIGLAHFSHAGWASIEISPESHTDPSDFFLMYKNSYSFEADSWMKSGKKTKDSVCIMSSGYSAGWCEEIFKISLVIVV